MKCHYEILDVSREADNGEIKSAYRKLALKWHPDKNLNNTDEAKEQFQLVQQAYEVLSDPQERAWYDKHREQILRGSNSEFQDNSLDVFPYFTTTCFKGYGDDENGFYAVYKTVFDKIIEEDMEFIDDKEEFCEIPRFGNSQSDYDSTVGPFYSYWLSYSTKKSYVWLDPYDISETRDRRVVKLIEKENKKVRQKAKKERNEEIRNLVAFVRKRDKRVKEHTKLMEAKVLENRQKQEEIRKQKRLERKQELLNESETQAEWAKFDNVQCQLEEIEKSLAKEFGDRFTDSEGEDQYDDNLYCVACNKIFKTPKAFANHESSKKHKENVEILKEAMLEEEEMEEEEESEIDLDEKEVIEDIENEILTDSGLLQEEKVSEEEISIEETKKQKKKKKKGKNVMKFAEEAEEPPADVQMNSMNGKNEEDSDDNFNFESTKKKNKKSSKNKTSKNKTSAGITEQQDIPEENLTPNNEITSNNKSNKKKPSKKQIDLENLDEVDTSHCCVTCKSTFQSKNKLFDHLKKTGHGVYLANKTKNKKNARERN